MERERPLLPPLGSFVSLALVALVTGGFTVVALATTGAFLAGTAAILEAGFLAGSGFLTAAFEALADLGAGFLAGAFLAAGVGLTGFPEGFRDEEGWDFFFNGAQLVPKSRARKDR